MKISANNSQKRVHYRPVHIVLEKFCPTTLTFFVYCMYIYKYETQKMLKLLCKIFQDRNVISFKGGS